MIKIMYTESGNYLEHLPQSFEAWIQDRVLLSTRLGERLWVQSMRASILFPMDFGEREALMYLRDESQVDLYLGDIGHLEVALKGTWVASNAVDDEGIFVTEMAPCSEQCLWTLWYKSHQVLAC